MELYEGPWVDSAAQNTLHYVQVFWIENQTGDYYFCIIDGSLLYHLYVEEGVWRDRDRGIDSWATQLGSLIESLIY
ncbi:MAG TPA: hypothetical protein VGM41_21835 [Chitinophagaceae bacterium]